VDFDDMLNMAAELLKVPDVRRVVANQQRHILVDEFQDVGERQLEVLKPLVSARAGGRSFSAVGDDDQTIYTWNGSTTRIFEMLHEHCSGQTRMFQLVDNYRSSESILRVGHSVLAQNTRRVPKVLRSRAAWAEDAAQCPPPLLWECGTPESEASAIAGEIEALLAEGAAGGAPPPGASCSHPREIAVLFRCFNFRGKAHHPLVSELTRRRIPHFVVREQPFWQRGLALDLLAYLRLAADDQGGSPGSDDAFLRALNRPCRGCGKAVVERIRERQRRAEEEGGSTSSMPGLEAVARGMLEAGVDATRGAAPGAAARLPARAATGLRAFLEHLTRLREQCATLRVDEAIDLVARSTGYLVWCAAERRKARARKRPRLGEDDEEEEEEEDEEEAAALLSGPWRSVPAGGRRAPRSPAATTPRPPPGRGPRRRGRPPPCGGATSRPCRARQRESTD